MTLRALAPGENLWRFRRLVGATILTTFVLVVVGGVVRVSDSGLGCGSAGGGLRGWPLCQGGLLPGPQAHTIVEYCHRALAAAVVILLAGILWLALRRATRARPLTRGAAVTAAGLVVVQAVLGGLTVAHGLETALVAAHLGTAMLLLATLLLVFFAARPPDRGVRPVPRSLSAAAAVACVLLFATIVTGGVIAGTDHHGAPGEAPSEGAHLACGREFPTCNGAVLPYGSGEMVDVQLAHRTAMGLAVVAIAAFALLLYRRSALGRLPGVIVLVMVAQVLLGASNVWLGEHPALIVAHLTLATLLWTLVAGAGAALAARRSDAAAARGWAPGLPERRRPPAPSTIGS
jgi:heme A synthase